MNAKLYVQLKEQIIAAIKRGEFAPGDQIPSQRELIVRYGMSHMTIRRAINELISESVIYAIPGKGIYVSLPKQEAEAGPLVSFTEDMAKRGMTASTRLLSAQSTGATTLLAEVFGVEPGTLLFALRRLRLADGQPMALQMTYLPRQFCPDLLSHDLACDSLYALLKHTYRLTLADSHSTAEAVLATEEEARLLGMPSPAPLLVTEQLTYLDTGQPVEFTRSAYRGDRYRLRLQNNLPITLGVS